MIADFILLSPVLIVVATGVAVLVMDLFRTQPLGGSDHLAWMTVAGALLALAAAASLWPGTPDGLASATLAGTVVVDGFTLFLWGLLVLATALTALLSCGYDEQHNLDHGEYYSFLAFALTGMMIMVAAASFLVLFLALEILSLAVISLMAMKRSSAASAEAALKTFFNGGLATAVMLYGLALLWGESGTLQLSGVGDALVAGGSPLLYMGGSLVLVGLAIKVALVPFHMWAADAYQGAPTPVGGFMAAAVKVAALAALVRVVFVAMLPEIFAQTSFGYSDVVILLAVVTMTVGNLAALLQSDVRRMLAYSGIAHAGYLLTGLLLVPPLGAGHPELRFVNGAVLYYFVAYALATLLAFGVLARLGTGGDERADGPRLNGLLKRRPGLALLMTLALVSLAGFPPTAGFFAKFDLLAELMVLGRGKLIVLLLIVVGNTLVSVYYYLRPVVHMTMKDAETEWSEILHPSADVALVILAFLVLALGLFPSRLTTLSKAAARTVTYRHAPNLFGQGPARLAPFARKDVRQP